MSNKLKDVYSDEKTEGNSQDIPDIKVPKDKHGVAYMLMFLFGIGALLPWNAILTALPFFNEKMGQYQPDFIFGFANNSLLTVVQIFILLYGYKFTYQLRISGGFLGIAVLMVMLPLVANYTIPSTGFALCMTILFIFGALGGIVQGSVFGMGGMLPGKYMGAIMFGNGVSGISLNVLRAICLAILPPKSGSDNNFKGSLVYFILAAVILVVAAAGMVYFARMPFAIYYIRRAQTEKTKTQRRISGVKDDMDEQDKSLLSNGIDINKTNHESNLTNSVTPEEKKMSQTQMSEFRAFLVMMKRSFLISWQFLISITAVFVITFTVFPGLSVHTQFKFMDGVDPSLSQQWTPLIFVSLFNLFDTVGRWVAGQPFGQGSDRVVLILTYSRLIFVVTFILIAKDVPPSWLFGVDADWFKITNMIFFALTNGWCSTQCAIKAPSRAPDDSKEQVGNFISVFLTLGIFLGTIIAIGMGHIF